MYSRTFDPAPQLRVLPVLAFCLMMAACGEKPVRITQESFSIDSPYKSRVDSNSAIACESARRVLLGDGYVIDTFSTDNTKGRKAYRSDGDRSTFIEMNIVCVDEHDGSMVYANGLLSTYDVKRSSGSASVGVSAFGSVSLPFGQSADSMVKTSDETIRDREFYRRFFNALNVVMVRVRKARQSAMQQTEQALPGQQKQGKSSLGEDTQTASPNLDTTEPADVGEFPHAMQVEPARTAEALDEAQPQQLEDTDPVVATPKAPVELVQPAVSATPDPAPAASAESDRAPAASTETGPAPAASTESDPAPAGSTESDPVVPSFGLENRPAITTPGD